MPFIAERIEVRAAFRKPLPLFVFLEYSLEDRGGARSDTFLQTVFRPFDRFDGATLSVARTSAIRRPGVRTPHRYAFGGDRGWR